MAVINSTDQKGLCVQRHKGIARSAHKNAVQSLRVISFSPHRQPIPAISKSATAEKPVTQAPAPPCDAHWIAKPMLSNIAQISQEKACGLVCPRATEIK